MTKYEKAIYELVNESKDHMSADVIYQKIRDIYPGVSLATIYNNLNKLTEEGLIRKIRIDDKDRYDRILRHDHIICARCGKIIDHEFNDLTKTLREEFNGDLLYYDLKVYSICDDCKEKDICA